MRMLKPVSTTKLLSISCLNSVHQPSKVKFKFKKNVKPPITQHQKGHLEQLERTT